MELARADILNRLRQDILPLTGYKQGGKRQTNGVDIKEINSAFPNGQFPLQAVHEFMVDHPQHLAATKGFIAGVASQLLGEKGVIVWVAKHSAVFPPAMNYFNVKAEQLIFIQLSKEADLLWVVEEALKCRGITAVIGELEQLDFTSSRRLQLAVEKSAVTGFIIRQMPKKMQPTACLTRWHIHSLPSLPMEQGMPGVGYPRWEVVLEKVRNGKPGKWEVEWKNQEFTIAEAETSWKETIWQQQTG